MRTKSLGRRVGAVAMVCSAALLCAPAARAATSAAPQAAPRGAVLSVPAGQHSATLIVDGAAVTVVRSAAQPAVVLTCTVTPAKPSHVGTSVSSVVTANCNTTAASVSFGTALYYDAATAAQNNAQVQNCLHCSVTVTAPYQTGQWKAGAILGYFDSQGGGQFTDQVNSVTVKL